MNQKMNIIEVNILTVYVLEVADDKWEVHGIYKDKDTAEYWGMKIVESVVNNYEHYTVTAYPLQ